MASGSEFTEIVPPLGDSISNATVASLLKNVGDYVQEKEVVAVFETDKVSVDIRASKSGQITSILAKTGDLLNVGQDFFVLDTSASPPSGSPSTSSPKTEDSSSKKDVNTPKKEESAPRKEESSPKKQESAAAPKKEAVSKPAEAPKPRAGSRNETSVPLKPMRLTIAKRLKESQNTAAMLTTFNEVDMHNITNLRAKYKDEFEAAHGIKLGFMSAFVKASAQALVKSPVVNAVFDMEKSCITYRDYVDISVAVSTPTGLVVPVLRDCQNMSFADVEKNIALLGKRARDKLITKDEMTGGTFTISNGGVYGSLMGTPIINAPQSAILGMHGIFKRPVAIDDQVVIRPMMYIALSYDHRLIDGKDAVLFLKDIKNAIEDPSRLLLDL
jgi:2-oxoglutarate dehydrogenase E2 component (dihydrolipoamide succinyltransferase)